MTKLTVGDLGKVGDHRRNETGDDGANFYRPSERDEDQTFSPVALHLFGLTLNDDLLDFLF